MWSVYLLWNPKYKRTYIGCTTDVHRRLRQHNGEIQGGAKSTRKYSPFWTLYLVIEGFKSRSEAMRWEKILKSRARGLKQRSESFVMVGDRGICPPGKKYDIPFDLRLIRYLGSKR